ncbi:uncharacterized protein PHACADRAFT_98847, partial [Phanerochaete carnosa HHB-10118-sp]
PVPGQNLTVKVVGQVDEVVEEGAYADVIVKVGSIKVIEKEFDLCEEARKAEVNISCPADKGEHNVVHTVTLPKPIPKVKFFVNIHGYTVEDDPLMCLDLWIDFRTPKGKLW